MHFESILSNHIYFESESRSVMSDSSQPHGLSPWNSPRQNTGVGSPSLLGIFPTQGSNPGLPHGRWILYQLSHRGSPIFFERSLIITSNIDHTILCLNSTRNPRFTLKFKKYLSRYYVLFNYIGYKNL